jgi:hypothetical protein
MVLLVLMRLKPARDEYLLLFQRVIKGGWQLIKFGYTTTL